VHDHQVEVDELVEQAQHLVLGQVAAVGVVRVADDGDPGAAAADERGVVVDVEREVPALLQRIHVDPFAGLQRLVGPAAEGGDGDREALPHEQVVDPGDQLGGAVAHGDGLRVESYRGGQLGRDRVGAARVELEYRLQVPSQVLEDLRRGEVRVARDAEVDRRLAGA